MRKFLTEVQWRFEDNSIYDLRSLKETAVQLLPVLEDTTAKKQEGVTILGPEKGDRMAFEEV